MDINMTGSDNYTVSIGIQNLSQPFENHIPASLFILFIVLGILGKFFTYVTKTHANLSTYSRKPGNYNDTIIFEIYWYHEKVFPNQFKIHIFATVKTKMSLLFWCNQLLLSVTFSVNKKQTKQWKSQVWQQF